MRRSIAIILLLAVCVSHAITLKCTAHNLVRAFNAFRRNPPALRNAIQQETGNLAGWPGDENCFNEAKNAASRQAPLPTYKTERGAIRAAKWIADLQARHRIAGHWVAGSSTGDRVNQCMRKVKSNADYREMISMWSIGKTCQHVVNQYYVDAMVHSRSHRKAMVMRNLNKIGCGVTANGQAEYTGVIFQYGYVAK